jgi:hypothetical protein
MTDTENETWAPIPGYEDEYEVSTLGRVKSLYYDKIIAKGSTNGEPQVKLEKDGNKRNFSVARLVLLAHGPEPPEPTFWAKRIDSEKPPQLSNVEWQRPITRDTKLDPETAVAVYRAAWRAENDPTTTHNEIAARFGIAKSYVSHIKNGRSWSHVTDEVNQPA